MRHALWLLLLCSLAHGTSCPTGQAKDENTLISMEQKWADAIDQHDVRALDCILAAEFEDADLDGKLTDRRAALAKAVSPRTIHHKLSDLHAHVYGDFAYTRGIADAIDLQYSRTIRVRFTDVYVFR